MSFRLDLRFLAELNVGLQYFACHRNFSFTVTRYEESKFNLHPRDFYSQENNGASANSLVYKEQVALFEPPILLSLSLIVRNVL